MTNSAGMVVLDTNVVSELTRLRPRPELIAWFNSRNREDLFVTVITITELCYGVGIMPAGETRERVSLANETMLNEKFAGRILNLDESAAREYADILAYHRVNELPADRHDCMIAAIARSNGASVATRNLRDFRRCGIQVINPWETGGTA